MGGDEYLAELPTAGKSVGRYKLYAQATDAAKNACPTKEMSALLVSPPPPAPGRPAPGRTNDLRGVLVVSSLRAKGIQVSVEGTKTASTVSKEDGSFEFKDLPAGAYKLSAKGNFKNAEYSAGPINVDVKLPPDDPTDVGAITLTK